MLRLSTSSRVLLASALLALATAPSAGAQGMYGRPPARFEVTPFGGWQWGGTFDTDAFATIPAGELTEQSAFSWGTIVSFLTSHTSAVELYYLRSDGDVRFESNVAGGRDVGGLVNNYIQIGGRQEFMPMSRVRPFITGSLGINVLDPRAGDLGSSTRFAWSLGGGAKFMAPNQRVGVRLDARWMVTPVPSGTYGTWCDYWGCFVTEGTAWLHQGHFGGGLILAF